MHLLDNKDRIGSLLLLVFSFTYLQYAFELPLDPTAGDESFNALLFSKLGFVFSSYLFLHASFLVLGERRILVSGVIAASLVVFLWLMLTRVFGIFLDSGDLYRFLYGLVS
jgi:hypothetical protein